MVDADLCAGYSAQQVRDAEAPLLAEGVPLMQRAADGLAEHVERLLPADRPARLLFLVGSGNNGGDALYAAERLAQRGHGVTVLPTSSHMHVAGLAAVLAAGAEVASEARRAPGFAAERTVSADIVVDGILGTGASSSPALRGLAREIVVAVRSILDVAAAAPYVVAVDLPSGIHADDGSVPDEAVLQADLTVTFGACKAGLLRDPGAAFAGRIAVVDIGLGPRLSDVVPLVPNPA